MPWLSQHEITIFDTLQLMFFHIIYGMYEFQLVLEQLQLFSLSKNVIAYKCM